MIIIYIMIKCYLKKIEVSVIDSFNQGITKDESNRLKLMECSIPDIRFTKILLYF